MFPDTAYIIRVLFCIYPCFHVVFHSCQQCLPKWMVEDWKNVTFSDESQILLRHADGRVIIKAAGIHGSTPSMVEVVGSCVMVWIVSDHRLFDAYRTQALVKSQGPNQIAHM